MYHEDRTRTTSWDAKEVQRSLQNMQGRAANAPSSAARSHPAQATGAQPAKGKKQQVKRRRTNPFLAMILWIVIVGVSSVLLAGIGWMLANDLCALNKEAKTVTIDVKESWFSQKEKEEEDGTKKLVTVCDMSEVAKELEKQGLVEYGWFFRLFSWVYNAEEKIAQGTYELTTEMDYMALIRGMRAKSASALTVDVSIPEGYSVSEIISLLAKNGVASEADLKEAACNYVFDDYAFVDNENLGDISRLEGFLFPDTYNFYVGGKATVALNSILSNFNKKVYSSEELAPLMDEAAEKGYDLNAIITIASLIERETDGSDRSKIASVIYNRLENKAETNYFLQIDAALVYAAGHPVTQEDYTSLDSPYNLYQHTGLPPTPIANPGLASIAAALQPEETDYYFYVLGNDKKHIFSKTLAEHDKAIASVASAGGGD